MTTYKEDIDSCIEAIETGWQETDQDRARLKLMIAKLKAERACIKFDIEREKLLMLCRCALADLEGIMPEYEPSGDREHPAWKTIEELRMATQTTQEIKARLEYLRGELNNERISYSELHELQSLVEYIDPSDTQLLEAAGVPEYPDQTN